MLNHFQILIQPVILLVEGEVHEFEAVGKFEHCVVGDCAAALTVETGGVYVDLDLGHHIDVGGAGERSNGLAVVFLSALSFFWEIVDIRDAFF